VAALVLRAPVPAAPEAAPSSAAARPLVVGRMARISAVAAQALAPAVPVAE
jgi:hypothetical protein